MRVVAAPLAAALALVAVPACSSPNTVALRAVLCNALTRDNNRASDDYSDLSCASQARIRVYREGKSTPTVERCVDFSATTPVSALFGTGAAMGSSPLALGTVATDARVSVEVAVYAAGGALCPADAPLLALGRSALASLDGKMSIQIPLGVRKGCGDTGTSFTVDPKALEDLSSLPTPHLALVELFSYDALVSTGGSCVAPTTFRGERRLFTATQGADMNGPTKQFTGPYFTDHGNLNGCIAAHRDDAQGGVDACLLGASMWIPSDAHLAAVRALNRAVPGVRNGALIVRGLDKDGMTSWAGARLYFDPDNQLPNARYVRNADWSDIAAMPVGTTSDGSGVAVFVDAPTGPYVVDWGDGNGVIFGAGGAADPGAVTTIVVQR